MSLEEYKEKRNKEQLGEAIELVQEYKKAYSKFPNKEILKEYFWLFEERNKELNKNFSSIHKLSNNEKISTEKFLKTKPMFEGYDNFIKYVEEIEKRESDLLQKG